MLVDGVPHRTVDWQDGHVVLIDQPLLPHAFRLWRSADPAEVAAAIRDMTVRGAGAIGATGAYGLALAAQNASDATFDAEVSAAYTLLASTRPTAQNLFTGLRRVAGAMQREETPARARAAALAAARAYADEDAAACEAIGTHGAPLLEDGWGVSTHCNAGWLAFVDWGSALAPVFASHRAGKRLRVFVDETRPRGQGARLTAWELAGEGVDHVVLVDSAFGHIAARGEVQAVIVGSDRVAANGDVANKIGTYGHAVIAAHLGIPFYVALPSSTIDPACPDGAGIPIEERSADEVVWTWGEDDDGRFTRVRTTRSTARNPAFDVTPGALVAGLVTEYGVFPASPEGVQGVLRARKLHLGDDA
jgi:methylthioribose-1-phosphate isomerase